MKKGCIASSPSPGQARATAGTAPRVPARGATTLPATSSADGVKLSGRILSLAWPAIVEQLLNMAVGLVNTYLVGHLGATPLAAVGLGDQVVVIFAVLFSAVAVGSTALVARHMGAEEQGMADLIASQSVLLGVAMGIVSSVATFVLSGPILKALGAAPDVQVQGAIYLHIVSTTLFLMAVMFVGNAVLRGAGDTRTPMLVMFGINLINIAVAYSLVNGVAGLPRMGVAGSAIGAAAARGVGGLTLVALLLRRGSAVRLLPRQFLRLEVQQIRRILSIGLPAGAEQLLLRVAQLSFAGLVTQLGTATYAAHQIGMMAMSLAYMPGWGFSVAATTLVGQELGAGRPQRAEKSAILCSRIGTVAAVALGLVLFLWAKPAAALFTTDQEVIGLAVVAMRAFALAQPLLSTSFVLAGSLRGAGETRSVLIISTSCLWGVRLPLGYLLGLVANLGLLGIWIAVDVDWVVRTTLLHRRFRTGHWKTLSI